MNTSGQFLLKRIRRELEQARETGTQTEKTIREIETHKQDLLKQRGESLVQLSHQYLPELSRDAIANTFVNVQSNLLSIVERKERRYTQIHSRQSRLLETQSETNNRLDTLLDQKATAATQLQAKESNVTEALKANEVFQKLSQAALQSEERLTRNEAMLKEIKKDTRKKLPAYKKSSLFQYLLKRKFGTVDYNIKGITRRWDHWIAKKINFGELRQSYLFLTTTPKLMKKELKRRKTEFDSLMEQIENFQQLEAKNQGIPLLLEDIQQIEKRIKETNQQLDRLNDDIENINEKLLELEQSESAFYEEAISRFRTFLEKTEHEVLEAHSKKTIETFDDRIVEDLGWVSDLLTQQEEKLLVHQKEKAQSTEQIKALEFVLRRSSQTEMGTDRCSFPEDFDIKELLHQNELGVLNKEALWERLKSNMILAPTWASQTAEGMTEALNSPGSRMIGNAMKDLATTALKKAASRGMLRRR